MSCTKPHFNYYVFSLIVPLERSGFAGEGQPLLIIMSKTTKRKTAAKKAPVKRTLPKGITRFTYENTSFQGYRVNFSVAGHNFCKYFSEKTLKRKCLPNAKAAVAMSRELLKTSRRVKGKLSKKSIAQVNQILEDFKTAK